MTVEAAYGGSAGPWRGTLFTGFEGALRVPFAIRWPGKIAAGSESDEIVHAMDLFPTLSELIGEPLPVKRLCEAVPAAVEALAYVGDESATGALMKALKDDGSLVRTTAAEALADIGDKSAIPALIEALEDSDVEVREFARDALEEMGIQKSSPGQ